MASYTLPHFGQLNPANLEEHYDANIEFEGREIELDINFGAKTIDPKKLDTVKKFMEKIADFDKKNKKYIEKDYNDEECDTVKTYVEHHLEEIGKDGLAGLVDFDKKPIEREKQLMKKLRLVRVGIYPEGEEQFAIFDYSIGRELTNYLVVIFANEKGEMDYMTMES